MTEMARRSLSDKVEAGWFWATGSVVDRSNGDRAVELCSSYWVGRIG